MERLWAPWRGEYVATAGSGDGCIFCDHLDSDDDVAAHVLHRTGQVFVLLNAYPYNTGHLMIAPVRHVADLAELSEEERGALMEETTRAVEVLKEAYGPQGFNVGMNLGTAGGAGIPGHLHMHVVPRWGGDTNFMTTVGDVKVLPEMLEDSDRKLRGLFGS